MARHQAMLERKAVGFECFCRDMSEYKDCSRDGVAEEYVASDASCVKGMLIVI